jgi:plastocyanin
MAAAIVGLVALSLTSSGAAVAAPSRASRAAAATVVAEGGSLPFSWKWTPAEVILPGPGRVTWENPTEAPHHVTFWDGPRDDTTHVDVRGSVTVRFKKPGVYKYWCDIFGHAELVEVGAERICIGMCGEVAVE